MASSEGLQAFGATNARKIQVVEIQVVELQVGKLQFGQFQTLFVHRCNSLFQIVKKTTSSHRRVAYMFEVLFSESETVNKIPTEFAYLAVFSQRLYLYAHEGLQSVARYLSAREQIMMK